MPASINPHNHGGRYLEKPDSLKSNDTFGVLVLATTTASNARLVVFSDRAEWTTYINELARKGHTWDTFQPIVFQAVQLRVAMQGRVDAQQQVADEAASTEQTPIDSRLELLSSE